jgi:PAS domain S-box-containing protein
MEDHSAARVGETGRGSHVQDPEHLRLVVDAAPIAIIVADSDGRITMLNERGARLFGYDPGELLGRRVESLVPDRFRGAHGELRDKDLRDSMVRAIGAGRDLYGLCKDGTEVALEVGLHPVTTSQGTFTLGAIVDITDRKHEAEAHLRHARAIDASELKSQFVATMSHELRTPLNAIIGMAELLSKSTLDERQRTYLETIETSSEALLAVISSILEYSKIWAGRVDLEAQDFELDGLLTAAAGVVAQKVQQKGLTLDTYVDPLLPRVLRGDPDRLRQILLNLVGNAVKFTERGHIVIRALPVATSSRHVTVRFEVQDSGIGIPRETLPKLFSPFAQGDGSATRRFSGTGLGLSISKRLVELMQGEIGVTSEPEGGSLFWFTARLTTVAGNVHITKPTAQAEGHGPAAAASAEAAAASAEASAAAAEASALSAAEAEAAALSASAAEAAAVLVSASAAEAAALSVSTAEAAAVLVSVSAAEAAAVLVSASAAEAAALSASAAEAAAALVSASAAEAAAVLVSASAAEAAAALVSASAAEAAAVLVSVSAAEAAAVLVSASAAEAAAVSASAAEAAAALVSASAAEAAARSAAATEAASALVTASAVEAAAMLASAAEAAAVTEAAGNGQDRGVLIAEDNAELQTVLVHQFAELAVPLTLVSDGAEAVAAVRRRPFALVFMDCQMPNLDGLAATRVIRDDERSTGAHVPIVAVTANAFKEDREACLAAGMDDYIAKPVRINDFRTMIERWTRVRRS